MTSSTFDHLDFLQRIDAYLAGGLDASERRVRRPRRLLSHLRRGPGRGTSIRHGTQHALRQAPPRVRLRGPTRQQPAPRRGRRRRARLRMPTVHPLVRRAAVGVAAAILLGGFGYVAQRAIDEGGLPDPAAQSQWAYQEPGATAMSRNDRFSYGIAGSAAPAAGAGVGRPPDAGSRVPSRRRRRRRWPATSTSRRGRPSWGGRSPWNPEPGPSRTTSCTTSTATGAKTKEQPVQQGQQSQQDPGWQKGAATALPKLRQQAGEGSSASSRPPRMRPSPSTTATTSRAVYARPGKGLGLGRRSSSTPET